MTSILKADRLPLEPEPSRRGFLKAILAAGVAPYVVTTAGVLMPVKAIAQPEWKHVVNAWTPDALACRITDILESMYARIVLDPKTGEQKWWLSRDKKEWYLSCQSNPNGSLISYQPMSIRARDES